MGRQEIEAFLTKLATERLSVSTHRQALTALLFPYKQVLGARRFVDAGDWSPSGLRLMEGLRLRVKDVDFMWHPILVREGRGGKDRVVMRPRSLVHSLGK